MPQARVQESHAEVGHCLACLVVTRHEAHLSAGFLEEDQASCQVVLLAPDLGLALAAGVSSGT